MLVYSSDELRERIRRVTLLLDSLYDYLPDAPIASGVISRDTVPGPAPGKRVPCGYCARTGRVLYRVKRVQVRRLCPLCEGSGWRLRRGPRDKPEHPLYEEPWDQYVDERVKDADSRKVHASDQARLTREIERLERDKATREGKIEGERYAWESRRSLYERMGSYRELRRALEVLKRDWPEAHAVIHAVHFRNVPIQLGRRDVLIAKAAVARIALTMRVKEIRVPPWLMESAAVVRQASAQELADQGLAPGKIGFLLKMSRKKVKRLLKAA